MAGKFYSWSQTAANNSTADSTINWAEGQAPSSVNDSARAMMAATASFRDDISGAIATGGTSTAYTVTSYQVFPSLALMANQVIAFTPHTTNTGTSTLNVDGLGAKPLRSAPSVEVVAGTLIQGTPYLALYNNSDAAFYLHGFFGSAYNIPIGGGMDYWGTVAPNSSFVFPTGQNISRTTYSVLFGIMGTTYGVGDGSTTFTLPDKTGRVSAMKEASATRLTTAGSGINGATMGAAGGSESRTLATANLPAYTPSGSISNGSITFPSSATAGTAGGTASAITLGTVSGSNNITTLLGPSQATTTFTGTAQGGTATAFGIVQPTIVCNYIIRII